MGFLSKLFGGGDVSLASVKKAVGDGRFADACRLADELDAESLSADEQSDLQQMTIEAGDGLARLNLNEALGLRHCGKVEQAEEYFQMALEKVCSPELKNEIEQKQSDIEAVSDPGGLGSHSSCASCGPGARVDIEEPEIPEAQEQQLELILTSYPEDLAERYFGKSDQFLEGFMLAQTGQDEDAIKIWAKLDPSEQDDLYDFELGSLLGRNGDLARARTMLERALKKNAALRVAVEALIPVLIAQDDFKAAEKQLALLLERGVDPAFCHAQLSVVQARKGETEAALDSARKALSFGVSEASYLAFAANLFEQTGALDEAEELLKALPASGCKGGINLPYAEFLLRQKKELGRILDSFNAACREEPENPRWQLRVAQTYLARQWKKDGLKLLRKVVDDPRLEPELAQEAQQLLAEVDGAA